MFTTSSNYYCIIEVHPNSTDNWKENSPFLGQVLSETEDCFSFSTTGLPYLVRRHSISSKLVSIGEINKSIDLFKNSSGNMDGSSVSVKGVGAVAKTDDTHFNLENLSGYINYRRLLGRVVIIYLGDGNSEIEVFRGTIFSYEPSRDTLSVSCRGVFESWDKELGKIDSRATQVSSSKILPIYYGDLSETMVPTLQTLESLEVDSKEVESFTINYYDEESDQCLKFESNDLIKEVSNVVNFKTDPKSWIVEGLDPTTPYLKIWNPPKISFRFAGDPESIPTDGYYYDTNGVYYEFIEKNDVYFIFTTPNKEPPGFGYLTYSVDSSVLNYTFCSPILEPNIPFNKAAYAPTKLESDDLKEWTVFDKAEELVLTIDDGVKKEKVLVIDYYTILYSPQYTATMYKIVRNYDGKGFYGFLEGTPVYVNKENNSFLASTKVYPSGVGKVAAYIAKVQDADPYAYEVIEKHNHLLSESFLRGITAMYKYGESSGLITLNLDAGGVNTSVGSASLFTLIDLIFPKLSIDAEVVNMYVLGRYIPRKTGDYSNSFFLCKGGANLPVLTTFGCGEAIYRQDSLYHSPTASLAWGHSGGQIGQEYFYDGDSYLPTIGILDLSLGVSGLISNLSELGDTRYALRINQGGEYPIPPEGVGPLTVQFSDPGLLIVFKVNPETTKLYASLKGRVSNSLLIENPVDIVKDIFTREIGLQESQISSSTTKTGWKSVYYKYDKPESVFSAISSFVEENGLILSEYEGVLRIDSSEPPSSVDGLREITDSEILLSGDKIADWSQEFTDISALFTKLDVMYKKNLVSSKYASSTNEIRLDVAGELVESVGILGVDKQATVSFDYIRDFSTLKEAVKLLVKYRKQPVRVLKISGALSLCDLRLAQWVTIDSTLIPETLNKIFMVIDYTLQPGFRNNDPEITVKLLEMETSDYSDDRIQEVPEAVGEPWQEEIIGEEIQEVNNA